MKGEPEKKLCSRDKIENSLYNLDDYDHTMFHKEFISTKERLSEDYIPSFIHCRDEEKKTIRQFIDDGIECRGLKEALCTETHIQIFQECLESEKHCV